MPDHLPDRPLDRTPRLLAIDDEPVNLKLLSRLIESAGYPAPVLVSDSTQAVDALLTHRPDLVLLDLNMPGLDGFAVLQALQSLDIHPPPPVVVLSAETGREHVLRALKLGARDYLTKPIDRNELMVRLRNLLDAQLAVRLLHDQKAVLEDMVRQRTQELERTRLQVVHRLGRAAEYRDNETGMHTVRMGHVSALLARSLGWAEDRVALMLNASPMHDVGKIGIPDTILLKPGKLNAEEWAVMKTHSAIGHEILAGDDSELLRLAAEIALHHHEKWDGSGYPAGLAGTAIPQSARIVAVADVFDALTSERPYKAAWTVEAALDFLREQSGRHFDPEVVEHFLRAVPEVLAIRARYTDVV